MTDRIPYPGLESHMHKRISLPAENRREFIDRWSNQFFLLKLGDIILSKIVQITGLGDREYKYIPKWAVYHVIMKIIRFFLQVHNRIEIDGLDNVPDTGAILIANHQGAQDPIIFLSAFGKPIGIFTDVGNGFIADALEHLFGFVTRRGVNYIMIEKMVRAILKKNKYFAIWPEGHPVTDDGSKVGYGFSGIIRVYATINARKNVLPIVPVWFQGAESFWWGERRRAKKVRLTFGKPYYLPREWLRNQQEGGKNPREIIDHIMSKIASRFGQDELASNHLLEKRREKKGKPWWS